MNQAAIYQRAKVTTAPRGQLVVLLYEGAIKALTQALAEMEAGRYLEKGQRLNKAIDIISELRNSLDLKVGGEIAMNLDRLYDFMIRHLTCLNRVEQAAHSRGHQALDRPQRRLAEDQRLVLLRPSSRSAPASKTAKPRGQSNMLVWAPLRSSFC